MWDDHYKIVVPLRPYENYALFLMVYNNEVWIGILLSVLLFMPCMILADKVFFGSTNWEANMGFVLSLICSDVTCKVPGEQEGDSIGKTFDLSFGLRFPTLRKCSKMGGLDMSKNKKWNLNPVFKPKLKPKLVLLNCLPCNRPSRPALAGALGES